VRVGPWVFPIAVIGAALTLQANLLRWLGPAGELNAMSVAKMDWPTLVSLLWACIGAALTISGRRYGSRLQWSAGAVFLVGAAIKLLLLDFGSLGQLANILAVIAAGGVFLLVGWLAPMPPARSGEQQAGAGRSSPAQQGHERKSADRFAWTVAITVLMLITISQCGSRLFRVQQQAPSGSEVAASVNRTPSAPDSLAAKGPPAPAVEREGARSPSEMAIANRCDEWRARLPEDYEPYLVTAVPADSGETERLVRVNAPGRNVVLVLMSTFPAYWTIRATDGSRIAGIWLPTAVGQEFRDVPRGAEVLDARDEPGGCASAVNGSSSLPYAVTQRVLGRPLSSGQRAEEGRWVLIGDLSRQEAVN